MFQGGEGEHFLISFWGFDIVPYDICYHYSAQQVMDNSCTVFFKTAYIVLVNHQEVAHGKNCCLRR